MKSSVFISWSGDASRAVADALHDWLPQMFQTVEPFVSSQDIAAGAVWFEEIGERLQAADFAVICVTPQNLDSPWLHFEAGAIGMATAPRSVAPYLLELGPTDLRPPLSLYQAELADEEGTRRLVSAINRRLETPLNAGVLDHTFSKWWPDLQAALEPARTLAREGAPARPERGERDLLEEVLSLLRNQRGPRDLPRGASEHVDRIVRAQEDVETSTGVDVKAWRGPDSFVSLVVDLPKDVDQHEIVSEIAAILRDHGFRLGHLIQDAVY